MSRSLRMKFALANGKNRYFTVREPVDDLEEEQVKACMDVLTENGAVFEIPVVSALKAEVVERTVKDVFDAGAAVAE